MVTNSSNIIPYGKQFIDNKDIKEVLKSLKEKLITTGNYVLNLEKQIKRKLKAKYVLTCSSGTAALHLSLLAIEIKKDDIVIMPAINFIASYNMCTILNAKIYLADVDEKTGQMTPKTLNDCIKKNKIKEIKLIITMYLGGYPRNIKEFYNLKKKFNCYLIEDACHALGASYKIKSKKNFIGSNNHSDICTFSLHPVKTITSGEGGIVTTKSKKIYNKLKILRSHGILRNKSNHWQYDVISHGFNYRLSDINCALAASQLKKIDKFISYRKKIYLEYKKNLKETKNLSIINFDKKSNPSFHLILLNFSVKNSLKFKQKLLFQLKKIGIYAQYHYIPIYKFKIFKKKIKLKNSEKFYTSTISLPVYFNLKTKDVKKISNCLKKNLKSL
jgi:dTDP-4-amino-4,6-dideoxygalactose transaminase